MTEDVKRLADYLRDQMCKDCNWFRDDEKCHYLRPCKKRMFANAFLSIVEALEQVEQERDGLSIMLTSAESAFETVKRERDAALTDLWNMCSCKKCAHLGTVNGECENCYLRTVPGHPELSHRTNWEWRGVCSKNGGVADA